MRYRRCWIVLSFLGLAGVASAADPRGQTRAVAAIAKLGGQVEYLDESFARPVVGVRLGETPIQEGQLDILADLPDLERLDLHRTELQDDALARLSPLTRLRSLQLQSNPGITDRGVTFLRDQVRLERLDLQGTGVTANGLAQLADLPNLRALALSGDHINDDALAQLANFEGLEELLLAYTRVTDDGLAHLARLPNLRRLHIRSGRMTDAGLAHLQGLPRLEILQIPSTPRVTNAAIAHLQTARPHLHLMTFRESINP